MSIHEKKISDSSLRVTSELPQSQTINLGNGRFEVGGTRFVAADAGHVLRSGDMLLDPKACRYGNMMSSVPGVKTARLIISR